jgi:hypothetical protein
MIKSLELTAVLLVLLLGAASLHAQTDPAPQAGAATDAAVQNTDTAAADQPTATPEETAPQAAPASSSRSPFDYQSSEEISEDLSVSFPVDI